MSANGTTPTHPWGAWLSAALAGRPQSYLIRELKAVGVSVSPSNISKWLKDANPNAETAIVVAEVLGASTDAALRASGHALVADRMAEASSAEAAYAAYLDALDLTPEERLEIMDVWRKSVDHAGETLRRTARMTARARGVAGDADRRDTAS